ncbi:secreted protein [Microdochium bolleyi]|uniref:Secreted protein n=1 Tax=Microdochium bolleyi TaxID=196109 RepID=A0A136JGK2_9PEZI|nr:secreted protein [Microdochium bolleyi]
MYWASLLTLAVGLVAAAPSTPAPAPKKVKVHSVKLLGSGCPEGTADVTVDATGSLFEATFSEYIVETGPGTVPSDWRKNCKLTINMEFDSGYQFSILETSMKGFAEIPKKAKGRCDNTFSFTGERGKVNYGLSLPGPYTGAFDLETDTAVASWSPCGGSTAILNMNTQCNLTPTHLPALIAVDSVSGKLTVIFAVQWRYCPK